MRYLSLALDVFGVVLFALGACGLAYLAEPLLAAVVGGIILIVAGALVDRGRRRQQ